MDKRRQIDTRPAPSGRLYWVDWLRTLAMGTIFLFHTARFFDYEDWHVKNLVLSHPLAIFVAFTGQWIMPLFFILSGISTFHALGHRTKAGYIRERFFRLVVPLVFGIFVLVPPQVYIERVSHGQFNGSFFAFFPHYFDGFYAFGGNFAWMGLHLWYLELLFILSLVTLPLFAWAHRERISAHLTRMTGWCARPGRLLFLSLPIFASELFVNAYPGSIGMRALGGWSPLTYLVFFVVGYVIATDDRMADAFARFRNVALVLGIVSASVGLFLMETGVLSLLVRPAAYLIEVALRTLNSWFWLSAVIGFGHRHLDFSNRALVYTNPAVLPFYILHQSVIVIVAFFLVGWAAPVPVKYIVLAASSFVVIMALYEGLVRRFGIFRFLFGMKA
jgi:surface polysaccharide O-acyltransferase-like enzyme